MCAIMPSAAALFQCPSPVLEVEGWRFGHHFILSLPFSFSTFVLQLINPCTGRCGLHKDPILDLDEKALYP